MADSGSKGFSAAKSDAGLPGYRSRINLDRWMTRLGFPAVLLIPLVMTRWYGSKSTNELTGLLLLLLTIPFLPDLIPRLRRSFRPATIALTVLLVLAYVLAWQKQAAGSWLNSQLVLYVGAGIAYPVVLTWLRYKKTRGLEFIFYLKLAGIFLVTAIYLIAIFRLPAGVEAAGRLIDNPPVHIHMRTMKYEMALGVCLSIYYATISKATVVRFFWLLAFLAFGYLTVWSGGRGAMLTVLIFVTIMLVFRILFWRSVLGWFGAFVAGGILVLLTGKVDYLLRRTTQMSAELNSVSSGRWDIWRDSMEAWWGEGALVVLFGAGPDAFRSIIKPQIDISLGVIQPHNLVLQILFEFGAIGLILFVLVIFPVGRRAMTCLFSFNAPAVSRVVAATLAAGLVFSMVDGLFYHALSLTFIGMLIAFLMASNAVGCHHPVLEDMKPTNYG